MSEQHSSPRRAWGSSSAVWPASSAPSDPPVQLRVRSWPRRLGAVIYRVWAFTQADYASHYSLEKALYLLHFRQTACSRWKRLLFTPWGCLVVALLTELIPLEDPSRGWRACPHFFLRLFLRTAIFNAGLGVMTQEAIPEMVLPPLQIALLSCIQSLALVGTLILYAQVFNVFPVPFAFFVVVPVYFVFVSASIIAFTRHVLLNKTLPEVRARFERLSRLNGVGPMILLVYAAYAMLFHRVGERAQFVLAALLQVLKVFAKRVMWAHAQITPGGDDLAGEHVTASAHFFHALFTATSLQSSKSMLTLALLVGWNLLYDVLSIRNLLVKSASVERAWRLVPAHQRAQGKPSTLLRATRLLSMTPPNTASLWGGLPIASSYNRHHEQAQRILLAAPPIPTAPIKDGASTDDDGKISDAERVWLREITHSLHWRENVLLRMYVDIFVPCIFIFFAIVVVRLPNRQFYPAMRDVDVPSLVSRVATQAGCKLVMFGILMWLLRCQQQRVSLQRCAAAAKTTNRANESENDHEDGGPTALEHLCFVLHAHRFTFQSKLLVIGLTVLDFPLTHFGNDLTFQFDWIRLKTPTQ